MNEDTILLDFLKYASMNSMGAGAPITPTTVTPPVLSGQPLKRTSNIPEVGTGDANGNTVSVKPATNNKTLKTA